MALLQLH